MAPDGVDDDRKHSIETRAADDGTKERNAECTAGVMVYIKRVQLIRWMRRNSLRE